MKRLLYWMAPAALLAGLALAPTPASAGPNDNMMPSQPEEEAPSKGDPWSGYVATGFLGTAILFVVCKSARR